MSTETTFKCDVCKLKIKDEALAKEEAFPLMWTTDNKLKINCPWRDMPLHICVKCVKAIVEFDASRAK